MLSGITVVDFTRHLSGPYCSMRLADMGARVIKMEALPGGDPERLLGPRIAGVGSRFLAINRSKESVALNLRAEAGKEIAFALASQADVVLESFRPGVMALLGLDYDSIAEVKPDIVYCSITGYGQVGPLNQVGGQDLNVQALSGLLSFNASFGGQPLIPGVPVADLACGMYASEQICAALVRREREGRGAYLDIAALDVLGSWMSQHALLIHNQMLDEAESLGSGLVNHGLYEAADGRYVAFAAVEEKFWVNFCHAVGREEWEALSDFRISRQMELYEEMKALFLSRTQAEWHELGLEVDCCLTAVEEADTLLANPFWEGRELLYSQGAGGQLQLRSHVGQNQAEMEQSPLLGAHTHRVLRERLHVTDEQLKKWEAMGLIGREQVERG
ncbi:MAG: CaiB/BaiF CoA transferase family protein [Clostridia bacterium]